MKRTFAFLAALLIIGTSFAGIVLVMGAPSAGVGTNAFAPKDGSAPITSTLASAMETLYDEIMAGQSTVSLSDAEQVMLTFDPNDAARLVNSFPDGQVPVSPASNPVCTLGPNLCTLGFGAAALVVLTAACTLGATFTAGIACGVALAGVVVVGLIVFLFGLWGSGNAASQAAITAGTDLINGGRLAVGVAINYTKQTQQFISLATNAFGYEAAHAALLQLGNTSFNKSLDLVQSNVAQQLDAVYMSLANTFGSVYVSVSNAFDTQLGTNDSSGSGCPAQAGFFNRSGSIVYFGTHTPVVNAAEACGGSTSGQTFDPPFGTVTGDYQFSVAGNSVNYTIFTLKNTTLVEVPCAFNMTFVHVSPNTTQFGVIGNGTYNWSVIHLKSGGLWNIHGDGISAHGCSFRGTDVFPTTNSAQLQFSSGPGVLWQSEAASFSSPPSSAQAHYIAEFPTFADTSTDPCIYFGSGSPYCVFSGAGNITIQTYAGTLLHSFLIPEANTVENESAAYYTFLRGLGYTNVNQIPPACLIPDISSILPPNIPLSQLSQAGQTWWFNLYAAYLRGLSVDFLGSNTTLNSTTFCNHALPTSILNVTDSLNPTAFGWLWLNGTGHNSNSTGTPLFTNTATWNRSGLLFFSPAIRSMKVGLGTTWDLPSAQTVWVMNVPIGNPALGYVNVNSPTSCVSANLFSSSVTTNPSKTVCAPEWNKATIFPLLSGGSSNLNGSAFTSNTPVDGHSYLFLTSCGEVLFNSGNPIYSPGAGQTNGTCSANVSQITSWGVCDGGIIGFSGCGSSTQGLIAGPTANCGNAFINTLATPFAGIPIIGSFACVFGWILAIGIGVIVVLAGIAVGRAIIRSRE
jgi:hypothetical protein